jgi:hypothetical protein
MEGSHSHHDVRQPFDLLAITNTTWQRKKAAGLLKSCLPTLDNLRNFLLTPTAEMLSFFGQAEETRYSHRRSRSAQSGNPLAVAHTGQSSQLFADANDRDVNIYPNSLI